MTEPLYYIQAISTTARSNADEQGYYHCPYCQGMKFIILVRSTYIDRFHRCRCPECSVKRRPIPEYGFFGDHWNPVPISNHYLISEKLNKGES